MMACQSFVDIRTSRCQHQETLYVPGNAVLGNTQWLRMA